MLIPAAAAASPISAAFAGVVHAHPDLRLARERHEASDLAPAHDLVAHQHVGHPGLHQRLRLAHLLAAHPHRAEGHLPARDDRALVGLGVRANPHPGGRDVVRHRVEVALEGVEIDEQGGRVDVGEPHPDFSRWMVHHRRSPALAEPITNHRLADVLMQCGFPCRPGVWS